MLSCCKLLLGRLVLIINAFHMSSDLLHSILTQCYVHYTVKLQVGTELCFVFLFFFFLYIENR